MEEKSKLQTLRVWSVIVVITIFCVGLLILRIWPTYSLPILLCGFIVASLCHFNCEKQRHKAEKKLGEEDRQYAEEVARRHARTTPQAESCGQ